MAKVLVVLLATEAAPSLMAREKAALNPAAVVKVLVHQAREIVLNPMEKEVLSVQVVSRSRKGKGKAARIQRAVVRVLAHQVREVKAKVVVQVQTLINPPVDPVMKHMLRQSLMEKGKEA